MLNHYPLILTEESLFGSSLSLSFYKSLNNLLSCCWYMAINLVNETKEYNILKKNLTAL